MSALDDLVGRILIATQTDSPFTVGKVVTAVAGGALDGNTLVSVSVQGRTLKVTYLGTYTPAVGDIVLLTKTQPMVILGPIVGTPA